MQQKGGHRDHDGPSYHSNDSDSVLTTAPQIMTFRRLPSRDTASATAYLLAWAATLLDQFGGLPVVGDLAGIAMLVFLILEFPRQRQFAKILFLALTGIGLIPGSSSPPIPSPSSCPPGAEAPLTVPSSSPCPLSATPPRPANWSAAAAATSSPSHPAVAMPR